MSYHKYTDYTGLWCKKKKEPVKIAKARKVCRKRHCKHLSGWVLLTHEEV